MATRDSSAKVIQVGPGEALAVQLGQRATAAAAEALRTGCYPEPTPEAFRRIAAIVSAEALAAGHALCGHPEITDEALDEAADLTGRQAVVAVLGPPARTALQ